MAKLWCQTCGERQFSSSLHEGQTCANGHDHAPSLTENEALALGFDIAKRLRRVIAVRQHEGPKRATIAKRSKEERDLSDATCTPKWLADFLFETHGLFDLDPCSNERSHIKARWSFSLEKHLDGIKLPWRGSVFKNNPFSAPMLWQQKAVHELTLGRCTELVELCKMDPSTDWWNEITAPVSRIIDPQSRRSSPWAQRVDGIGPEAVVKQWWVPDLWLFNDRIQYDEHPDLIEKRRCEVAAGTRKGAKSGKSSNNFCSAMIHHRFDLPPLKLEKYATLWRRP